MGEWIKKIVMKSFKLVEPRVYVTRRLLTPYPEILVRFVALRSGREMSGTKGGQRLRRSRGK